MTKKSPSVLHQKISRVRSFFIRAIRRRLGKYFTPRSVEEFDQMADRFGGHFQFRMDIDPASHWNSPGFLKIFGGFQPPGESRPLRRSGNGDRVRSDMLLLLLREITVRKIPGALAELGVYQGDSATLLHHYCPERRLYLFDTFAGFSSNDLAKESIDLHFNQQQQFTDTGVDLVLRRIGSNSDNLIVVAGWFPASASEQALAETYAFVHLDADLEAPISAGLEFFWPRLSPGGFVVVHDYNAWPGTRLAVDQFRERERPVAIPLADKSGSIVLVKPEAILPA